MKKRMRSGALPVQHWGRSTPATRSLRSPLLATTKLTPLWLDLVPPIVQDEGYGRRKLAPAVSFGRVVRPSPSEPVSRRWPPARRCILLFRDREKG